MLRFSRFKSLLRDAFCGTSTRSANTAKVSSVELMHAEGSRHYLLALPSQEATGKRPLVIILHGGGSSAKQVLGMAFPPSPLSLWLEIAEREQLVIVAPQGAKRGWNDSFADMPRKPTTDDTNFISTIIDQTIADNEVDPARVYVIGVSRGGMMAYRLAIEIAPKLAAFCAVLAPMPVKSVCKSPEMPLSALIIAGTSDPFIPYAGGKFYYPPLLSAMMSIDATVSVWRTLAGLQVKPSITPLVHRHATDHTRATRFLWGSDPHQLQVGLLKIDKGGHAEPSQTRRYPWLITGLVGAQNADLEVAEEAWNFFKDKRSGLSA